MAVGFQRFKSKTGFESPSFVVDSNGNIAGSSLTLTNSISVPQVNTNSINISNRPLFTNNGTVLSATVVGSSLQTLGTLTDLVVEGDTRLRFNGSSKISVVSGTVEITSEQRGSIDNVNIGTTNPGTLKATSITVENDQGSPGSLTASRANINFNASVIAGSIAFSQNPTIGESPTQGNQVARKDYVDNNSIAYAVVFGA